MSLFFTKKLGWVPRSRGWNKKNVFDDMYRIDADEYRIEKVGPNEYVAYVRIERV